MEGKNVQRDLSLIRKTFLFRIAAVLCMFLFILFSTQTVQAADSYTVTYHANGGTFKDGSDTNVVTYGPPTAEKVTKTSKTSNVSDDGSSYSGGYGDNKAITDKVTIPGAKELKVTITYATESTSYDWVCVYDGKTTPSASNYSSSVSGKLGGTTKTTKTFTVTGDTVQFFFRSDGSSSNYYGYYATVEGTGTTQKVLSGTYQEPVATDKQMSFKSWYTDKESTTGNVFDPENVTKSQDVYAKYDEEIITSGTTGEVTWKLYKSGLLRIYPTNGISGTMDNFTYNTYINGDWSYTSIVNEKTKYIKIESGVKANALCAYMFTGFDDLITADVENLDVSNTTDLKYMFASCCNLENINVEHWNVSNVTSTNHLFYNCNSLKELDVKNWNVNNVTDFGYTFGACGNVKKLDIGNWDVSNATNMERMFLGMPSLTSININNWNVSNVTNMAEMFYNCKKLGKLDLNSWNVSNVTNLEDMFEDCEFVSLNIDKWNIKKVKNMSGMFSGFSSQTPLNINNWNVSSVTNMDSMFWRYQNSELNISNWDVSNVTNMGQSSHYSHSVGMFSGCENIKTLNLKKWDVSKVTDMAAMFSGCKNLTKLEIENWNTENVKYMSKEEDINSKNKGMFSECNSLTHLDISDWNTSNVINMSSMFSNCNRLLELNLSDWDVKNVKNMNNMFLNCINLKKLNLSNWKYFSAGMYNIFSNCNKLIDLDIGWEGYSYSCDNSKNFLEGCNNLAIIRLSYHGNLYPILKGLPENKKWIHVKDIDGNKTFDTTTYTSEEIINQLLNTGNGEKISGTWKAIDYTISNKNPDGTYEYVTDDDLWTINGNAWTYTFDVFDDSVPFYFWEENLPGFSSPLMLKTDGSLLNVGSTGTSKVGTVTNKQNLDSGSLKVSKTVVGGDTETKFKFQITLTGDHIKDACEYSDVLFTKGVGTITLKDGESKTIEGIPAGTTYSVEEVQTGLYQSQGENTSGTIEKDKTKEVPFTNTKIKDEPPTENTEINVIVSKKVLPEKNKETGKYQMSAAFTGLKANTSYGLSNGTEFTSDPNGNGYVEFALAQDEELVFLHLPVGCTYQLTEEAGAYTSSYEVTDDKNAGTIAKNEDKNTEEQKDLSTGKETAEAGENVKVTFTNEVQYLQDLTLTKKTVRPNGSDYDSKESFSFTITFSSLKPGESFASTIGKVKADEDGTAEKTITLKNGEKAEFYKIPYGAQYQITEEKNSYKPSYSIDAETTVKKSDTGKAEEALSTETETIDIGEDDVVAFTNEVSERYTLPEAGSHALEFLAGVALITLLLGCASRKQFFCQKSDNVR